MKLVCLYALLAGAGMGMGTEILDLPFKKSMHGNKMTCSKFGVPIFVIRKLPFRVVSVQGACSVHMTLHKMTLCLHLWDP